MQCIYSNALLFTLLHISSLLCMMNKRVFTALPVYSFVLPQKAYQRCVVFPLPRKPCVDATLPSSSYVKHGIYSHHRTADQLSLSGAVEQHLALRRNNFTPIFKSPGHRLDLIFVLLSRNVGLPGSISDYATRFSKYLPFYEMIKLVRVIFFFVNSLLITKD